MPVKPVVTIKRVGLGQFDTFADGVKTPFTIYNGSLGMSGHGTNTYGVTRADGSIAWLGPLRTAKAYATAKAEKFQAQAQAPSPAGAA